MKNRYKIIDYSILYEPMYPLIRRKYFTNVFDGQDNKIFKWTFMIYYLDGLIFTSLVLKHT